MELMVWRDTSMASASACWDSSREVRSARTSLRTMESLLDVGVCGTDREIDEGHFGVSPDGEEQLVLGHELLAHVERGGHGFAEGDLVAATVRRSCGRC